MKNFNLLLALLICFGFSNPVSFAQTKKDSKYYNYRVWLKSNDPALNTIGYITKIDDHYVTILDFNKTKKIPWKNVKGLKFRREGSIVTGLLIGTITGGALGYGLTGKDEGSFVPGLRRLINGVGYGVLGGLIGGGIGTIKMKIRINGDANNRYKIPHKYL